MLNAPAITNNSLRITDSTISISDLLDFVNKYFPDILPEDVLKHYGHTERPQGELGESALFSRRAKNPADSKNQKYWKPDLTAKEWAVLDRRLPIEIYYSNNDIDSYTKWLYNDKNGTRVFAIYGIGDGTEPTVLYAEGGKKATKLYENLKKYLEERVYEQGDPTREDLDRLLEAIKNKQGRRSNRVSNDGNTGTAVGDVLLPEGEQRRDTGGDYGRSQTADGIKAQRRVQSTRFMTCSV